MIRRIICHAMQSQSLFFHRSKSQGFLLPRRPRKDKAASFTPLKLLRGQEARAASYPMSNTSNSNTTPSLSLARALGCSTESLPNMPPLDLFVTQLQCDSSEARVDGMRRLKVVADAMGTEATLSQLLPFLATNIAMDEDEEDEILFILADQLGQLVPQLIPGYRALPILPILERLAAVEETVVRDKAVESIQKIVPVLLDPSPMKDDKNEAEGLMAAASTAPALLLAMAKRLSGADWFTAKVSAAGILPVIYHFYNSSKISNSKASVNEMNSPEEAKRELRLLYKDLSEDDTPMVKRSAAKHLGKFVEAVANLPPTAGTNNKKQGITDAIKNITINDMVPIYQTLCSDEQDSVRLFAVVAAGSYGKALNMDHEQTSELIFPVIKSGCVDQSWRVRHNLGKEFSSVAATMGFANGNQARQTELFHCFASLLQDAEAEVRAAAVTNIAEMTRLGGSDLFSTIINPTLGNLADDPVVDVRSRLAQTLMDCCDEQTRSMTLSDKTILSCIQPLIESFLSDEFPEVQLHILTKLSRIADLLHKMDVVVQNILIMSKDKNWRVREAVSLLLPHLGEAMGMQFFGDHLLATWFKLLFDRVAEVRIACVRGIPKLLSVAGPGWIQDDLLSHYTRLFEESRSYLNRIAIIRSVAELCKNPDTDDQLDDLDADLVESVVNFMIKGLRDHVANVRMVSAIGINSVMKYCEEGIRKGKIEPALRETIEQDTDIDCKYFARIALDAC